MRASISRAELFAFVRTLGGVPNLTRTIVIEPDQITVTSFRLDEQGRKYAAGDEVASEVTTIAIVGDGEAEKVRMRHPNLDTEIDVPATAVGHHAVAGWEVAAPEPPSEPESAPQGDPAQEDTPEPPAPETKSETPRGRRKAKEE